MCQSEEASLKPIVLSYSRELIKEFAPEEIETIEPLVDLYLNREDAQPYNTHGSETLFGLGNPELYSLIVIPIVVAIVKAVIPIIIEKRNENKLSLSNDAIVEFKLTYDSEVRKLTLDLSGKNKKISEKLLQKLYLMILEELED